MNNGSKACFVFNTDESGFGSDPTRLKAIGKKGEPLSRLSGGSGRESRTTSASGEKLPPLIVFKGAAVQARRVSEKAYPGTQYTVSSGGWMEMPLRTCFVPHVMRIREEKGLPHQEAVLIFDGHASHITLDICKLALKHRITLVRLPSHLTDKLQPLDKCVFGPVKIIWDRKLAQHGRASMGRGHYQLSKKDFVETLAEVWELALTPQNIIPGFRSTSLN